MPLPAGAVNIEGGTGTVVFYDSSNAGNGDFTLTAGTGPASSLVQLRDNSSAGNADFSSNGVIYFIGEAEAGMATINLRGAATSEQAAGVLLMSDNTSAGSATIVGGGGAAESSTGAGIFFFGSADAANATLMASGDLSSASGGQIYFYETSTGGAATFVLSGRGGLDISLHVPPGLTIGALQGDGTVSLGANTLVLDNRGSTEFPGILQNGGIAGGVGGSLAKINGGTLTLSGPNSYTGGTIVSDGTLLAITKRGSSTGTGPVAVDAGTLGGTSTLTGPITVGTGNGPGASIAPGVNGPGRLSTRGSITFQADATYLFELSSSQRKADQISARGATISSGALFSFVEIGNSPLSAGTVFIVINNTSRNPIAGTFSNLPDGSSFASNGKNFAVSYTGGTGNDLALTVLP